MSVKQSILKFAGRVNRHGVYLTPNIPIKKLNAARSQFIFSSDEVIVLYDDTVFGSGKDGIAITEEYIYAKQLWEAPRSVKISDIYSISSQQKVLNNLDIYINDGHFTTISSTEKSFQPFILGILEAAKNAVIKPVKKQKKVASSGTVAAAAASALKPKAKKRNQAVTCGECSVDLPEGAKFCLECGAKVMPKGVCMECRAKLPEMAKFCPECGTPAGKASDQNAKPKSATDGLHRELAEWLSAAEQDARIDSDGDLGLRITAPALSITKDVRAWIAKYDIRIESEGVCAETSHECAYFGREDEFSISTPYCHIGRRDSASYEMAMKLQVYTLEELEVHEIELKDGALKIPKLSSPRVKITKLSAQKDDDGSYGIDYALEAYPGHLLYFEVSAAKPDPDAGAWAAFEEDSSRSGSNWIWDVEAGQKLYVCFGEYKLFVDGVEASFAGTAQADAGDHEGTYDEGNDQSMRESEAAECDMDWENAANRAFNYYFSAIRKGEDHDTAGEWFRSEIAEQTEEAGISYDYGWHEEVSPEQMRIVSDALASRIRGLNDEQGYSVNAEFYQQFISFVSNLIYDRRQASDVDLDDLQSYWDEGVWKELPTECGEGFLNSPADEGNYDSEDHTHLQQKESGECNSNQIMNFELKVVYRNADTGHYDEQLIALSTDNEKIQFLGAVCLSRPTPQSFEQLFRAMYDNPTMDGAQKGALYDELWPIMSRWAFDKLGWHDVTVNVIGLKIDNEDTKLEKLLETGMVDDSDWALQLAREGYMYCYV